MVGDDRANRKLIRLTLADGRYDMPKVDGFEAIASFQKEYPSIPVIVSTGIADPEVGASLMRQGISDYLVKPVDVRTLIASVGLAIDQRQLSCA